MFNLKKKMKCRSFFQLFGLSFLSLKEDLKQPEVPVFKNKMTGYKGDDFLHGIVYCPYIPVYGLNRHSTKSQ